MGAMVLQPLSTRLSKDKEREQQENLLIPCTVLLVFKLKTCTFGKTVNTITQKQFISRDLFEFYCCIFHMISSICLSH